MSEEVEREIVEVMARAIFDIEDDMPECEDMAQAAFAALDAAGFAIVPKEPTGAMIEAGYEAVAIDDRWCVEDDRHARKLFRAMLAASKE